VGRRQRGRDVVIDLELATYEQIMTELENRFDNFIFCGKKPIEGTGEKKTENLWNCCGDYLTNIGMAGHIMFFINKKWEETTEEI